MNVCMCAHMHMTWRLYGGQRTAFGKRESWGLASSCQAWRKVPLPSEPFHQP